MYCFHYTNYSYKVSYSIAQSFILYRTHGELKFKYGKGLDFRAIKKLILNQFSGTEGGGSAPLGDSPGTLTHQTIKMKKNYAMTNA